MLCKFYCCPECQEFALAWVCRKKRLFCYMCMKSWSWRKWRKEFLVGPEWKLIIKVLEEGRKPFQELARAILKACDVSIEFKKTQTKGGKK